MSHLLSSGFFPLKLLLEKSIYFKLANHRLSSSPTSFFPPFDHTVQ